MGVVVFHVNLENACRDGLNLSVMESYHLVLYSRYVDMPYTL